MHILVFQLKFLSTHKCVTAILPTYNATDHSEGAMPVTDDGACDMANLLTSATYTLVQVNLVLYKGYRPGVAQRVPGS